VYGIVLVLVAALAISQLKLETGLVNRVVEVLLVAGAAAFALTLGLGTRDVAKNIIAGVYARDVYQPRMTLSVAGASGTVEEVGTINTRIRTVSGEAVYIPNGQLMEMIVYGTPAQRGSP
jgi:small-conductance mechanosensitive channel